MIVSHRLTTAPFVATPNMGGALRPELLVLHYTVSWPAKAVIGGFTRTGANASAHLVLDLDGTFTQMVPFDRQAWHAGKSEWKGRSGCNAFSLGIEIVNPGPVFRDPIKGGEWRDVNKRVWTGGHVELVPPDGFPGHWRNWAPYTEPQLAALETVCRELCREYALGEIVGHSEIAPGRKFDPGPAFPMDRIRRAAGLLDTDPAPAPIAPDLPTLRVGSTGEAVRLLQERLRLHGFLATVDGAFGPATEAAVRRFQKSVALGVDGIVGAISWAALMADP